MFVSWQLPHQMKDDTEVRAIVNFINEVSGLFIVPKPEGLCLTLQTTAENKESPRKDAQKGMIYSIFPKLLSSSGEGSRLVSSLDDSGRATVRHVNPVWDERVSDMNREIRALFSTSRLPFFRKLPWPGAKSFAVALTHDVDLTRKYGAKMLGRFLIRGKFRDLGRVFEETLSGKNPYWVFPELLQFYQRQGWRATFFFLAKSWEGMSYRYNIQSKKFSRLLRDISTAGHEVALHSSLNAFDHPGCFVREERRLERALGKPVMGVRQHYLRVKFPRAWEYYSEAGFQYDSSCGFNDELGFRAGTSFPFQAFDPLQGKLYDLYEIPFSVMDYAWVNADQVEDKNWQKFMEIASTVQRVGGLLNILWHPSNLAESLFSPYWNRLVDWLNHQDCYQNSLSGILNWWRARSQVQMKSLRVQNDTVELILTSSMTMEDLALELVWMKRVFSRKENIMIEPVAECRYKILIKKLLPGENHILLHHC